MLNYLYIYYSRNCSSNILHTRNRQIFPTEKFKAFKNILTLVFCEIFYKRRKKYDVRLIFILFNSKYHKCAHLVQTFIIYSFHYFFSCIRLSFWLFTTFSEAANGVVLSKRKFLNLGIS